MKCWPWLKKRDVFLNLVPNQNEMVLSTGHQGSSCHHSKQQGERSVLMPFSTLKKSNKSLCCSSPGVQHKRDQNSKEVE
ncbi:hypothetical protein BDE02_04G185300 [Populus trichocarpa]|nr:hypothetical protein BDE02_04G185300 [Populus trichocarpa]